MGSKRWMGSGLEKYVVENSIGLWCKRGTSRSALRMVPKSKLRCRTAGSGWQDEPHQQRMRVAAREQAQLV